MIKAGGTNVAPREVELAIESQPGVMHGFVVGVPDATTAGARPWPPRWWPSRAPRSIRWTSRPALRSELASYKVPRHVAVFAEQQDLPWLESGKIDLQALRRLLSDRISVSRAARPDQW